jgi:hypothetical protein
MLLWSSQDENCKFIQKEKTNLVCKPRNLNNPLNGGLPIVQDEVVWVTPDPARSDVKTPYLSMVLNKGSRDESKSSYSIELRLKVEKFSANESWFKGEAVPATGSQFLKSDQNVTSEFFKYGYAEMTLVDSK